MPDPRDLLGSYRDTLKTVRKGAGPAGVLIAPLQAQADLLDQLLEGQQAVEAQLETMLDLVREAPAMLRGQAKAFAAASTAFDQAAELMNAQAELLEKAGSALKAPARALRPAKKKPAKKRAS